MIHAQCYNCLCPACQHQISAYQYQIRRYTQAFQELKQATQTGQTASPSHLGAGALTGKISQIILFLESGADTGSGLVEGLGNFASNLQEVAPSLGLLGGAASVAHNFAKLSSATYRGIKYLHKRQTLKSQMQIDAINAAGIFNQLDAHIEYEWNKGDPFSRARLIARLVFKMDLTPDVPEPFRNLTALEDQCPQLVLAYSAKMIYDLYRFRNGHLQLNDSDIFDPNDRVLNVSSWITECMQNANFQFTIMTEISELIGEDLINFMQELTAVAERDYTRKGFPAARFHMFKLKKAKEHFDRNKEYYVGILTILGGCVLFSTGVAVAVGSEGAATPMGAALALGGVAISLSGMVTIIDKLIDDDKIYFQSGMIADAIRQVNIQRQVRELRLSATPLPSQSSLAHMQVTTGASPTSPYPSSPVFQPSSSRPSSPPNVQPPSSSTPPSSQPTKGPGGPRKRRTSLPTS